MGTDAITGAMGSLPPQTQPGLNWSRWCRCESSFSLLLVPSRAGIFAVGEEVLAPGESAATAGKRLLAVLLFEQAKDLSRALSRLFTPASPIYERPAGGRCFVRYTVIEDYASRGCMCCTSRVAGSFRGSCGAAIEFACWPGSGNQARRGAASVASRRLLRFKVAGIN